MPRSETEVVQVVNVKDEGEEGKSDGMGNMILRGLDTGWEM